ncbi:hypothetical protein MTO96_025875 [Rhipicephalus appendiculatus]
MMVAALFGHTGHSTVALAFTIALLGQVSKLSARNEQYARPQMVDVTLESSIGTTITASWLRPTYRFDHYRVDIIQNELDSNGNPHSRLVAQCAFSNSVGRGGSYVCGGFESCKNVSLIIRTYSYGPPERTFVVNGMEGIFVPGHDPDPPSDVTMAQTSPPSFRLKWKPPKKVHGRISGNKGDDVRTPHRVGSCAYRNIIHRDQTQITCDNFKACVNASITVHTQIKSPSALSSPGATLQGIFMPGKDLPEVVQLSLTDIGTDFITVSWQQPSGCFDDYVIEVAEEKRRRHAGDDGGLSAGSCASGLVIDRGQTSVTCGNIEACEVRITVHTRRTGLLGRTSPGVSLHGIVMHKKVSPGVRNLTLSHVGVENFTLSWLKPKGCFDYYTVKVTDDNAGSNCGRCHSIVSCNNGAFIHPSRTNVTCDQPETCTNVTISVQPHVWGLPESTLNGDTLAGIDLHPKVSPVMRNLTLSSVGIDNFTLSWQKPGGCFEYYKVQVIDNNKRSSGHRSHGIVTCNNGALIEASRTSVTCDQPDTCTSVTITVQPHVSGLPESTKNGDTLAGVFLLGKAPPPAAALKTGFSVHNFIYFSFRSPRKCIDNVSFNLVPVNKSGSSRGGRCNVHYWDDDNANAYCDGVCGKVIATVQTKRIGPPERVSPLVEGRPVYVHGPC